ncbi:nitrophenyl compound nitroreductase subunit ArsF family protein, partial [Thermodesulfobacteriota bacterium]
MKIKSIITKLLLFFVVVSLATLLLKEQNNEPAKATEAPSGNIEQSAEEITSEKIIVYYFHGNRRCSTCKAMEAYTKKAVQLALSNDFKGKDIELLIVNVDSPENEHFVQDYELTFRSIVIAYLKNGKEQNWKKFENAWELANDEIAFVDYIQEGIASMYNGEQ